MTRPSCVLSRRLVLQGLAASATATALPARAAGHGGDAMILTLADLHSPYARMPAILDTVRAIKAENGGTPTALVINGDIFERGNVAALRSQGAADFAFLKALADEVPTFVNLGNHETALLDDMGTFVAKATQAGVQVISNLVDSRTERFYTPVSDHIGLGGIDVAMVGVATTNPFVYRPPVREVLTFLDPASFVETAFAPSTAGADLPFLVTHAGVTPDKALLPLLPEGTLVLGAHDHLDFQTVVEGKTYLHSASWGTKMGVVSLTKGTDGVATSFEMRAIEPVAGDAALTETIDAAKAEHLTEEDNEVITEFAEARDIHASILLAADAVRTATEADVAVLGHTTFGAPLGAGPLTKYDFDAFIRFDGGLSVVTLSGEQLAAMLTRANQFTAQTLDGRTGDYVHVAELDIDPSAQYRFATNGWTARNQNSYLGTTDLAFEEAGDLRLKPWCATSWRADGASVAKGPDLGPFVWC